MPEAMGAAEDEEDEEDGDNDVLEPPLVREMAPGALELNAVWEADGVVTGRLVEPLLLPVREMEPVPAEAGVATDDGAVVEMLLLLLLPPEEVTGVRVTLLPENTLLMIADTSEVMLEICALSVRVVTGTKDELTRDTLEMTVGETTAADVEGLLELLVTKLRAGEEGADVAGVVADAPLLVTVLQ